MKLTTLASTIFAASLSVGIASHTDGKFESVGIARRVEEAIGSYLVCVPKHQAVPWYRAHNTIITDHFYTAEPVEIRNAKKKLGYEYEGISALVFPSVQPGAVPFYRLYNPRDADHFYTTNVQERDNAVKKLGYTIEEITGYIYARMLCGTFPLYRLYNVKGKDHFYTTSEKERDKAAKEGWKRDGIAGYVFKI